MRPAKNASLHGKRAHGDAPHWPIVSSVGALHVPLKLRVHAFESEWFGLQTLELSLQFLDSLFCTQVISYRRRDHGRQGTRPALFLPRNQYARHSSGPLQTRRNRQLREGGRPPNDLRSEWSGQPPTGLKRKGGGQPPNGAQGEGTEGGQPLARRRN